MCPCCAGRGVEEPQTKEVETGDTKALEMFKGEVEVGAWVDHKEGDLEQE